MESCQCRCSPRSGPFRTGSCTEPKEDLTSHPELMVPLWRVPRLRVFESWLLGIITFSFCSMKTQGHLLSPCAAHLNPESAPTWPDFKGHILLELVSTVDSSLFHGCVCARACARVWKHLFVKTKQALLGTLAFIA